MEWLLRIINELRQTFTIWSDRLAIISIIISIASAYFAFRSAQSANEQNLITRENSQNSARLDAIQIIEKARMDFPFATRCILFVRESSQLRLEQGEADDEHRAFLMMRDDDYIKVEKWTSELSANAFFCLRDRINMEMPSFFDSLKCNEQSHCIEKINGKWKHFYTKIFENVKAIPASWHNHAFKQATFYANAHHRAVQILNAEFGSASWPDDVCRIFDRNGELWEFFVITHQSKTYPFPKNCGPIMLNSVMIERKYMDNMEERRLRKAGIE